MHASRTRNRRIYLFLLMAVLLGVISNHFGLKNTENGVLAMVDERELDVLGELKNVWTLAFTQCSSTKRLDPTDPDYQEALKVVQAYSPPQSQKAHVSSVLQQGPWILIEAEFDDLLPSVVLLNKKDGGYEIVEKAVWSGYTKPWKAAPMIRQYIKKQAPGVPSELIDCFRPQSKGFQ